MWKDFLYFSKSEKRGIIVLVALIGLFVGVYRVVEHFWPMDDVSQAISVVEKGDLVRRKKKEPFPVRKKAGKEAVEVTLQPFDPNTADSLALVRLGLPGWMAKNVLKYRAKGGKFRDPEDFRKIYGLSDEQYVALLPYIRIEQPDEPAERNDTIRSVGEGRESLPLYVKPFKYEEGITVDLNVADTTELKKIPWIGTATAKRIVAYRERLGGFYDVNQLKDIQVADELLHWFRIEAGQIRRMNLNTVGIERLKAHPYINFYQAKVIVEHRKRKGRLRSLSQLSLYEEFPEEALRRIEPYVGFE